MPSMSGLEACSRIIRANPTTRVLIFTMHESGRLATEVRQSGAHGYVVKSRAARDLISAMDRLLSGGTFFDAPLEGHTGAGR
jgi:DNA-binding NarL/FixJ family response regulator